MKYNEKYGRWFTKGGLIYRYDSKQDKLILCKQCDSHNGYKQCSDSKRKLFRVHRAIYETFVSDIPNGYEIDHEDTHKDNNALSNLKLCTHKENMNNPKTRKRQSELHKGNTYAKGKPTSDFGKKFKEHYGLSRWQDLKLYYREYVLYRKYKRCSWE